MTRDDTIGGQLSPHRLEEDVLDNRLLQFVGMGGQLEPHLFPVKNVRDSIFLLTSDGAHSIGRKALEGVLRSSSNTGEVVRKIVYIAEAIGVDDNASAIALSISDLDLLPPFGSGSELTLWTGNDKLEIWLATQAGSPVDEELPNPVRAPKLKKNLKVKPKAAKKSLNQEPTDPEQPERPQLNIEFGAKNSEPK